MRTFFLYLIFIFICINFGFSQEKPSIALIPLYAMGVSETEAAEATNLLGTAIEQTDAFIVIEQTQVKKIIGAQSFSLNGNPDEAYAAKIGKLLSAEQIIIGSFSHIGEEYILKAKITDTRTEQNIKTEKVSFKKFEELSSSIRILANKLAEQPPDVLDNEVFNEKKQETNTPSPQANAYIFQAGIGSGYSFYFYNIRTILNSMNADSLIRIPFNMEFLFGKKMSTTTAWTAALTSGIDSFSDSSDSFQLYTIMLSVGIQYIPFGKGLTLSLDAGGTILIPNTTLNYKGGIGIASSVSINVGYFFETLKFSNLGIVPGIEIKLAHSEMLHGSVNQIYGYLTFGIR